jgi:hypothetical protein
MSIRGRYLLDKLKGLLAPKFKLPCPPYGNEEYWENVYQKLGPDEVFEWGNVSFTDNLLQFEYIPVGGYNMSSANASTASSETTKSSIATNFAEVINVQPGERDKKILILGCGYSLMGEEMVQQGWLGPIIQVDISRRAVHRLQERWMRVSSSYSSSNLTSSLTPQPHDGTSSSTAAPPVMEFLQDDATELNAIPSNSIHAVIDKGLIDALFCSSSQQAQQDPEIQAIIKSVHRVLVPHGGIFTFLSFSQPPFLLHHTTSSITSPITDNNNYYNNNNSRGVDLTNHNINNINDNNNILWKDIQVRKLTNIYMYRYEKQQLQGQTSIKRPNEELTITSRQRKSLYQRKKHNSSRSNHPFSK